jgi:hypothetical protein
MNKIISNNKDIMDVGVANLNVYASHKTVTKTLLNIYKFSIVSNNGINNNK